MKSIAVKGKEFTVPDTWSDNAAFIAASKYAKVGEKNVSEIFDRVSFGIYGRTLDAIVLSELQLQQVFAFNSPVYFNIGVIKDAVLSACFILGVEDNMNSIRKTCTDAWGVFIGGAGVGLDLSPLRENGAPIRGVAGASCGPLPLLAKVLDSIGHATRSGGVTRRSAIMLTMADHHPDVMRFIEEKTSTERLLHKLKRMGVSTDDMNDPIYDHIHNQQANRAVRLSDDFMYACVDDHMWSFTSPYDGETKGSIPARQMLHKIAECLWECGDPGIQFSDTINRYHTVPQAGDIESSNPCSEFLFINNSACNLASINLMKFYNHPLDTWDRDKFADVVRAVIKAQDRIVDIASYPTEAIKENCQKYRPLGLGFTNLGGLLMAMGVPYDSDKGRHIAAAIAATMNAQAYITSHEIAVESGKSVYGDLHKVLQRHVDAMATTIYQIEEAKYKDWYISNLLVGLRDAYDQLSTLVGCRAPFANALTTLIAPTGTISFLMDADTTGIEPAYALSYEKEMVGGGTLRMPLESLELGLRSLDYGDSIIGQIKFRVRNNRPITDLLDEVDVPVFATAIGDNMLTPNAHLDMMAAVQPHISGAISKTVNLPSSTRIEDVERYIKGAWRRGLKAVTFYRDNSKAAQVLHVVESCAACGAELVRTGTCMACPTCGDSSGVCS